MKHLYMYKWHAVNIDYSGNHKLTCCNLLHASLMKTGYKLFTAESLKNPKRPVVNLSISAKVAF